MKCIFDFDHTIFDMSSMHEALLESMNDIGVSSELYASTYARVSTWKFFTVEEMASLLSEETKIQKEKIIRTYQKVGEVADLFVYDDVADSLQKLKEDGHDLLLLSWGDNHWQERKIHSSGLSPHFSQVLTVSRMKSEIMKELFDDTEEIVVIDDKPAELKAIQVMFPNFHYMRMKRPNGKYSDQPTPEGMHEVSNMQQALDLISSLKHN